MDTYESDLKRATNVLSLLKSLSKNREDLSSNDKPTGKVDVMLKSNKDIFNKLITQLSASINNKTLTDLQLEKRKKKFKGTIPPILIQNLRILKPTY